MKEWNDKPANSAIKVVVTVGIVNNTLFGGIVGSEKLTYDYWGDGMQFILQVKSFLNVL